MTSTQDRLSPHLVLELPMAVAEVEARLSALGTTWERSKLPPSLIAAGYRRCRVTPAGQGFLLEFLDQGRHPPICARVRLVGAPSDVLLSTTLQATCQVRPVRGPLSRLGRAAIVGMVMGGLIFGYPWDWSAPSFVFGALLWGAVSALITFVAADYWQRELTPVYVASLREWFGLPAAVPAPASAAPSSTRSN